MHVRPLNESSVRFVRNSVRCYLEGRQRSLRWIAGVIRSSGVPAALLTQLVQREIDCRPPSQRGEALEKWINDGQ